jgi:hypothetical protein
MGRTQLPLVFHFLRFAVLATVCQRAVFAMIFLTGGAIPVTITRIGTFTVLVDLIWHFFTLLKFLLSILFTFTPFVDTIVKKK